MVEMPKITSTPGADFCTARSSVAMSETESFTAWLARVTTSTRVSRIQVAGTSRGNLLSTQMTTGCGRVTTRPDQPPRYPG